MRTQTRVWLSFPRSGWGFKLVRQAPNNLGGLITDNQPQIAAPLSALETNFGVLHLDHVDQEFRLPPGTLAGTDEANAQLLIHYGVYEQLRYSPGLGWLTYNCNEGRWVLDRDLVRAPEIAGRVLRQGVKAYTERLLMSSATKENFTVAKGWQKMVGTLKSIHNALDAVKGKPKFLTPFRA